MPMTSQFETANGVLQVTGSLDRGSDADFTGALEKYCASTPPDQRTVDMTHVRWLAPTGAKVLIQFAQETLEKSGKMRVLASRHVFQTLNLLGAKTWMNIEVIHIAGNRQSGVVPSMPEEPKVESAPAPAAPKVEESLGMGGAMGDLSLDPNLLESSSSLAPVYDFIPPALPSSKPAEHAVVLSAASVPVPAPRTVPAPKTSGQTSSSMPAVRTPAAAHAPAAAAPVGALAYPLEDLAGAAHLLRMLHTGKRYIFHFGMGEGFSAIVRDRVGGPWITVEVDGIKKWVNLELVATCEQL